MGFFKDIPPPFDHQATTTQFIIDNPRALVLNDPGTGKTRAVLDAIVATESKALVFAPKSILEPAWLADARKFTPQLRVSVAYAHNRAAAFNVDADVYVTNHDAVTWVVKHPEVYKHLNFLVIDESTAFKNPAAKRSKAMRKLAEHFDRRVVMTGTPTPNGVLDIWHQALIVDDGERLGSSFYRFRDIVAEPIQTGPQPNMVKWVDKEGSADAIADQLSDITIRYRMEDCIDLPENVLHTIDVTLSPALRTQYDEMLRNALIMVEQGEITAINAASMTTKLLQIASGSAYGEHGTAHKLDDSRIQLICELVNQRDHSVVAFMWKHQRDALVEEFKKRGWAYAVIDGETNMRRMHTAQIVEDFQDGAYKVLLAHPQSAGHGLTLTRAATTIWASPTYNAEHFLQFNRRIYRAGQQRKTETILIQALDTIETQVCERLQNKVDQQIDLLSLLQQLNPEIAA